METEKISNNENFIIYNEHLLGQVKIGSYTVGKNDTNSDFIDGIICINLVTRPDRLKSFLDDW